MDIAADVAAAEARPLPIVSFAPRQHSEMLTFRFSYDWTWEDGKVTHQSIDIDAVRVEGAEIMFHYRVMRPKGVVSEKITDVQACPRRMAA